MSYLSKHTSTKVTPQSAPIPGSTQVANSAGGYSWAVDCWTRMQRFLILGSEGGSYYATEKKLTLENTAAVRECIRMDGRRAVDIIVDVSRAGRAPRNEPALFALALAAKEESNCDTRAYALSKLSEVARTGTHLLHLAAMLDELGGWGRGTRSAFARWYNEKLPEGLAYQLIKYQQRDGWSHRDVMRLAHPVPRSAEHARLFDWACNGGMDEKQTSKLVNAFEAAKKATIPELIRLIQEYRLPREAIPTEALKEPSVWEALLHEPMGMTALIRNLATMTRVGLIAPLSAATKHIVERLQDEKQLLAGRVHPIQILSALLTYSSGHSTRGSSTWAPSQNIVSALDVAFYKSFGLLEKNNARTMLAVDISGSMDGGEVAGVPGLTPRIASAAMALVTANTSSNYLIAGFSHHLVELEISPRDRLDTVVKKLQQYPMGSTDCSLPMTAAQVSKWPVDLFVTYTDSETYMGHIHPAQALKQYRKAMGINSKSVVVGMVSNGFTIADPNDRGMLDVVGFDTATPNIIADFAKE